MKLHIQKRIAGDILKCSKKKVVFDSERLENIKEAITKADLRSLIIDGAVSKRPVKGQSRVRARKRAVQKRKGKRRGFGSRKGKKTARLPRKEIWMNKIRAQRKLLKELKVKDKVSLGSYRDLYRKSKGGFFRSLRHIKLYIKEHDLMEKK